MRFVLTLIPGGSSMFTKMWCVRKSNLSKSGESGGFGGCLAPSTM